MSKKRIIIFVIIALLLIAGIVVNIIAWKDREDIKNKQNQPTNVAEDVDNASENETFNNTFLNNSLANTDLTNITEEDLELSGEKYNVADVQDKDGNTTTLELEENKPMVMLFWNNTEDASMEALKNLQSFYDKYSEKITFASIVVADSFEENKSEVEKVITENEITIPVYYDTLDASASKANNVSNVPSLVMINKKGEKINTVTEDINTDVIEANLDILAENY